MPQSSQLYLGVPHPGPTHPRAGRTAYEACYFTSLSKSFPFPQKGFFLREKTKLKVNSKFQKNTSLRKHTSGASRGSSLSHG